MSYHQIDDVTLNSEVPRLKQRVTELESELAEANHWRYRHCADAKAYGEQSQKNWEEVERLRGEAGNLAESLGSAHAEIHIYKKALEKSKVALELSVRTIHGIAANNAQHEAIAAINEVLGEK